MVHLRNGNLWTTVDTPDSYDHDELLSICDIHLAYIGNGQFAKLRRKMEPSVSRLNTDIDLDPGTSSGTTGTTCRTDMHLACDSGTTSGTTCSANENNNRSTTSTYFTESATTSQTVGTIKSDPDTLDELLSRILHFIHVSTPPNISGSTESSLIKPSFVKLRKLNEADIQLWTMANTPMRSKAPSKVTQMTILIKSKRAISSSVSRQSKKQTRRKQPLSKASSNKSSPVRTQTINKSTCCSTVPISLKPSSRITRAQKIRKRMKSPTFKITVHGLKRYKHRYSYISTWLIPVIGDLLQSGIGIDTIVISQILSEMCQMQKTLCHSQFKKRSYV